MSTARDRFDAYVDGLSQSVVVRREMARLADDLHRESLEKAAEPHPFYNDKGGNAVCTICWNTNPIHRNRP
jgi:hypothetical protein